MKRIKYILLTIMSSLCVCCMQPFDLKLDDDPIIFLEAFPGVEDMVVFRIAPAYSYSNSAVKPEFKPEITFTVNGEQVPVVLNKDNCMSGKYEETFYVADYKPVPGDEMSVEVASEGFRTIYAQTIIPEAFPERKIDFRHIDHIEETYDVLYVSFKDDESSDISYGIQIHNERVTTYPDGRVETEIRRSAGYQIVDDYEIAVPDNKGMIINFNGWTLDAYSSRISGWDDDTFNGKDAELSMAVYGGYDEFFEYVEENEAWYDPWSLLSHNKLILYTFSPEFYRYVIAQDMISENSDFIAGLAPTNFCYSNIKNGYGIFAGVYCVETEWITREMIERGR